MTLTNDLIAARAALKRLGSQDPWGRMSQKLLDEGAAPQPADPSLGRICNVIRAEPGIVQRVRDEGFDACLAGVAYRSNPYTQDGPFGWWAEGWCAADDNMAEEDRKHG